MVAELTDIPLGNAERKTSTADFSKPGSSRQKKRPKWIQAATREPVYSVLDSNETTVASLPAGVKRNVVVISAVKSEIPRERNTPVEQRELPYVWLPRDDKAASHDSSVNEVEEEDPLYSVVKKPKKVRLPEVDPFEKGVRPRESSFTEREIKPQASSRQEELKKWLQIASKQLPEPKSLFRLGDMYANQPEEPDQSEWKRSIAIPRGVVGLVGPYRVYQNPNERREYMLQEEELVEEVVDSVSEIAARENVPTGEHHQRAKWKLRDDDEETLVPDIRDIPGLEEFGVNTTAKTDEDKSDWRDIDESTIAKNERNEMIESRGEELKRTIDGIISGREERAVDVPDEASNASTFSLKEKKVSNEQHEKDSLNETGSTTGGTVEGAPGGAPSRGERNTETEAATTEATRTSLPTRSLVSRILSRARSPDDLLDHSEPFSQLWIVLSNVYGELVVVLMMALCLAEVMDTPVPLLSLQGVFLMYLYVGSIAVIISKYKTKKAKKVFRKSQMNKTFHLTPNHTYLNYIAQNKSSFNDITFDTPYDPQGVFLMSLYVGSIAVIISKYKTKKAKKVFRKSQMNKTFHLTPNHTYLNYIAQNKSSFNDITFDTPYDPQGVFLMSLYVGSIAGVFLMYLYVGSIAVIISIYIWVLVDSCGSLSGSGTGVDDAELGGTSLTRFGSLKRAHISRSRTAPTSFYIRVGALLFGLATLVFNGLEMAMHSMMQGAECLSDVVFVHPVLHGLFTFLQMHFLFVNSQVLVERFGLAARFGFTHLAATNIAVWVRLVIWDSAQEWTYFVHLAQRGPHTSASTLNLRGFPGSLMRHTRDLIDTSPVEETAFKPYQPISNEQISQVIALQECLNTNTLGQLWTSSIPFLYPFIVQFSLIAAAVTFVMGQNVGRHRLSHKQKFHGSKDLTSHTKVGCDGSSKGLFLGILCMVAGIVVILIFLVVREDENFPSATLSWLTCGTLISILTLSSLMTASGLIQVRQMSIVTRAPAALDNLLSNVALFGVQLYSIFTIVVSACSLVLLEDESNETRGRYIMLLAVSILQLIQSFAQSTLIAEASKRSCITRFQMIAKPARQVITFLLFSNSVLWAFDTVITQNWISQELQLRFFGVLAWGVLSRIGLPLLIFYRFHSCVLLLEAWNKCYRTPRGEHPLN